MAFGDILKAFNQSGGQPGAVQPMQSPIGMPPVGSANKEAKNEKLALMLYALGGALGGKDIGQSAAAFQQIQAQRQAQEQQKIRKQQREQFLQQNPQYATQIAAIEAGIPKEFLIPKPLFEGQSTTNQFYNTLLQGQQDESIRSTPQYKTAYNYLSQPKTETFINEQGQQVTRSIPGMISKQDYLPPTGVEVAYLQKGQVQPPMVDSMKTVDKDIVVELAPERRKDLKNKIDTSQQVLSRLDLFDKTIDEYDPDLLTVGTARAKVSSDYNDLLLVLKDYARLGVLAGPDLTLLENWVGNPMGFLQNLLKGGAEGTKIQIKSLRDTILRGEAKIRKELGEKIETPQGTTRQETAFLNGRQIIPNNDYTGWIYKDTGEPAQ
jgi:hypothetical protein